MSEGALRKCLRGMSPRRWYECLNGKVFFWLSSERLSRLLSAQAYRDTTHCVLTVETAPLLRRHVSRITLSPINSGSTIYNPQPRGSRTFLPLHEYPFSRWAAKRGAKLAIAELAVQYAIPDILEFTLRAERRRRDKVLNVLYQR